jgi:hypothetical protein
MKQQKNWPLEKLKVLDICQQVHKQAEEIYLYLSGQHQEERVFARIFGELAIDKCNHSDAFKMASKLRGGGLSDIRLPAEAATARLNKLRVLHKWVLGNPMTVAQTFRFSIKMEESLEEVHILKVVTFFQEQDMALLTSTLKTSGSTLQMVTEEYMNLTLFEQDPEDMFAGM